MTKKRLPRIETAEVIGGFSVRLKFTDGVVREIDLSPLLRGPIFQDLHDPARFAELRVDEELGTIVWPNGADIDPDVLYGSATPAWQDDTRVL